MRDKIELPSYKRIDFPKPKPPLKLELPKERFPVVVAIQETPESVLLAANNNEKVFPNRMFRALQSHPTAPLAWGYSGNHWIGYDRFTPWLQSYQWPPKNLDTFEDEIISKWCTLNGDQRRLIKSSGAKVDNRDLADLVVACYLDKIFCFWVYNNAKHWHLGCPFTACYLGPGAREAGMLYHWTMKEFESSAPSTDILLAKVIRESCGVSPHHDVPIHICRVSKKGVEQWVSNPTVQYPWFGPLD